MEPPEAQNRPGPHPEPPADLHERPLPLVDASGPWTRIHRCIYDALHFGASRDYRFDAPDATYGVLYAADDAYGAFIETLGRVQGLSSRLTLTTAQVAARCYSEIETERPLHLVNLTGPGLAQVGADARLCTGNYTIAQRWSRALWDHPQQPDGLYYRCRGDPDRCSIALYDHVRPLLRVRHRGNLFAPENRALSLRILDHYAGSLLGDTF